MRDRRVLHEHVTALPGGVVSDRRRPRRAVSPGWRMVWVLAVTETISYAALFYCFAVMVVPMRVELGVSTAAVSGALSLSIAVSGLAAPLVGQYVDRHGAREVMSLGSVLAGAGVLAWSQARTLPHLYAAFVVVGVAGAMVLYEPAFAVINTWFRRRRPTALLTMTVVAGFSSTIFLPLSQLLVDHLGWRGALGVLAGLVASCAVPHALVLRRAPEDLGLAPDGLPPTPGGTFHRPTGEVPTAASQAVAVRWLTMANLLHTVAVTVVAVHLVAYLRDDGLPALAAATGAGALGVLSVTGRLILTGAATRLGLARTAAIMLAGQAVGVMALFTLPGTTRLVVFVLLFGAGFGVMTIARAVLLGQYVPPTRYSATSGRQVLLATTGRVGAPVAAGALITSAGYVPAFTVVAVCSLAAAAALLRADELGSS
jgi:MFS family permease